MRVPSVDRPLLSLVTVCKGRLDHLRQTLPAMVALPSCEVILVDYGCPQGSGTWAEGAHPEVHVLRVADDPDFCLSRARNLGARQARGPVLFFIDADVRPSARFSDWYRQHGSPDRVHLARPRKESTAGSVLIPTEIFRAVGGYDEAFRAWGGEDREIMDRVRDLGCDVASYPSELIEPVPHGDELRRFDLPAEQSNPRELATLRARIYRAVKRDLRRLGAPELQLEQRLRLMARASDAVLEYARTGRREHLRVQISPDLSGGPGDLGTVRRVITYVV